MYMRSGSRAGSQTLRYDIHWWTQTSWSVQIQTVRYRQQTPAIAIFTTKRHAFIYWTISGVEEIHIKNRIRDHIKSTPCPCLWSRRWRFRLNSCTFRTWRHHSFIGWLSVRVATFPPTCTILVLAECVWYFAKIFRASFLSIALITQQTIKDTSYIVNVFWSFRELLCHDSKYSKIKFIQHPV